MAESASMLPGGAPFGQLSECEWFVAYEPTTDEDLGLAVATRLARVAAMRDCGRDSDTVDLEGAETAVAEVRRLLPTFGELLSCNAGIRKYAGKSDDKVAELRDGILAALRKIDRALGGE